MKTGNILTSFKGILCFALLLLSTNLLLAQDEGKTTITLKSGEKVTGKVTEAVPDQYIKMELPDGSVKKILSADVASMQTEQSSNKTKDAIKIAPSVIGGIGVSYDLASKQGYVLVEPKVIGGFKAGCFRMGAGLSFIYAKRTAKSDPFAMLGYGSMVAHTPSLMYLPVFANFHFDFGKKKVKPSLDISGGYPVDVAKALVKTDYSRTEYPGVDMYGTSYNNVDESNAINTYTNKGLGYFDAGVGVTYAITKKLSINAAVQYQLLAYQSKAALSGSYSYSFWNAAGQYYNYYNGELGPYAETEKRILHSMGLTVSIIY